jgi:hypothetical protein
MNETQAQMVLGGEGALSEAIISIYALALPLLLFMGYTVSYANICTSITAPLVHGLVSLSSS